MEWLAIGVVLAMITGVVMGYIAYFGVQRLAREQRALRAELVQLRQRLNALAPAPAPVAPPKPVTHSTPEPKPQAAPFPEPASSAQGQARLPGAAASGPSDPFDGPAPWLVFLQSHWMVLLGGLSLALAGIFLVQYSMALGLLSPPVRVAMAVTFGVALIALASWLKQHREDGGIHAPCAGAGVMILYACVLVSGPLYRWLPETGVFLLLAAVSLAAMGLALRHGPVLAALGILGAFAVPLLVKTDSANLAAALGYALIVAAGGFVLLRRIYRDWLWWGVWLLALAWLLLSLAEPGQLQGWRSLYLTALIWLGFGAPLLGWRLDQSDRALARPAALQRSLLLLWGCLALCQWAILVFEAPSIGRYVGVTWPFFLAVILSRHPLAGAPAWPWLMLLAPLAELFTLACGPLQPILEGPDAQAYGLMAAALAITALAVAGPLAWHRRRADLAALACAVPMLMALWVDLRLGHRVGAVVPVWGYLGLMAGYAAALWQWRRGPASDGVSAVGLLAVQASLSLALVAAFGELRLTLALALQWCSLIGLGRYFVGQHTGRALAWVARALLLTVLLRLTLNPWLPAYGASAQSLLITYLGSFVLAALALWQLHRQASGTRLRQSFEVGTVQLAALAVAALTRYGLYGDLFAPRFGWLEAAIYVMTLLVGSALYRYRHQRQPSTLLHLLAELQLTAALGLYAVFALGQNPLLVTQSIGVTPLWNPLLLVYGLPALLLAGQAWLRRDGLRSALAALAGAMALLYAILTLRHLWHGALVPGLPMLPGELYSYSVLGLAIGIGLMVTAARLQRPPLQHLGTAALLVVIVKIFLWDMAGLDGLWRVASFLGLGVTLLGVAYLYNRMRLELSGQGGVA
ncbi:DUF2339 domain-containing protein [Ferrimonas balearica]|uniref:DUF2339 domain-containing protein n=1 Tax=Ferrimonas balearica TaxID=44012 RepID=UPI001C99EFB1|nr:DUF2339 domain-containing protein [Ferrimonas balearica]MBY5994053.1 DUF2339 domain-containing protein [Ferrimonas balearica]